MRSGSIRKIEDYFIDVTPAPTLRRIVAFDDRMAGRVKVFGRMPVRRVIATADVAAGPAQPQVDPAGADLQAFFAPAGAWRDIADRCQVPAGFHRCVPLCFPGATFTDEA